MGLVFGLDLPLLAVVVTIRIIGRKPPPRPASRTVTSSITIVDPSRLPAFLSPPSPPSLPSSPSSSPFVSLLAVYASLRSNSVQSNSVQRNSDQHIH
ncbi:hypothetical protein CCMSSC00406_0009745 [Pleurotus cornucopiae]|uniref:Uncharacterized protein n=1 Tax=Pleurotus cornucopiae TaxID=5321 RepID=A0ACB7JCZ6_PLECO|nr:hypothetical protein CCMSSC00406_0009745 [Pleurotus cornucopiae]